MPRFIVHTDRRELEMFRTFFPDEYLDSTYVIDFEKLYAQGYRGLIFDIDNTLVPHGALQMSGQKNCL